MNKIEGNDSDCKYIDIIIITIIIIMVKGKVVPVLS
jgi:hypothetical protein